MKSEVRSQKSEVRSQKSEVRSQKLKSSTEKYIYVRGLFKAIGSQIAQRVASVFAKQDTEGMLFPMSSESIKDIP